MLRFQIIVHDMILTLTFAVVHATVALCGRISLPNHSPLGGVGTFQFRQANCFLINELFGQPRGILIGGEYLWGAISKRAEWQM